jgi:predicted O-methyltransferase YrrM
LFSSHKRGHGIHSPFLFDLITRVFRNKINDDIVLNIERIRKRLISDNMIIMVTDFGSGQKRKKGSLRKVSEIARNSSVPAKYGKFLAKLSGEFGSDCIVELGTSFGIGTMYLASGARDAQVYTVEGCPVISEIADENFKAAGYNNIRKHNETFAEAIGHFKESGIRPGLVFIDGDHSKEKVIGYFNELYSLTDDRTVLVIDDIYNSAGMGEAWDIIKRDKRVTISVDIFRMGLVFFRKGMTPAEFIIRY